MLPLREQQNKEKEYIYAHDNWAREKSEVVATRKNAILFILERCSGGGWWPKSDPLEIKA